MQYAYKKGVLLTALLIIAASLFGIVLYFYFSPLLKATYEKRPPEKIRHLTFSIHDQDGKPVQGCSLQFFSFHYPWYPTLVQDQTEYRITTDNDGNANLTTRSCFFLGIKHLECSIKDVTYPDVRTIQRAISGTSDGGIVYISAFRHGPPRSMIKAEGKLILDSTKCLTFGFDPLNGKFSQAGEWRHGIAFELNCQKDEMNGFFRFCEINIQGGQNWDIADATDGFDEVAAESGYCRTLRRQVDLAEQEDLRIFIRHRDVVMYGIARLVISRSEGYILKADIRYLLNPRGDRVLFTEEGMNLGFPERSGEPNSGDIHDE